MQQFTGDKKQRHGREIWPKFGFLKAAIYVSLLFVHLQSLALYATENANGMRTGAEQYARIDYDDDQTKIPVGELLFRPCRIDVGGRTRALQCARLSVPENPSLETSKKIELFVGRIPAMKQSEATSDPLLFLAGGPGQAATEAFLFVDRQFPELAKTRDFYFVDQRGTGFSSPLRCDNVDTAEPTFDEEKIQQISLHCLQSYDADVRVYTTENFVRDLELLRVTLDIEKWNLFGVSYGTRVGMSYAEFFPASVRSMVLDSVVPPQHILGSEVAKQSQRALDTLIAQCNEDENCATHFPKLESALQSYFSLPDNHQLELRFEDLSQGKLDTTIFRKADLLAFIRFSLYAAETRATLLTVLNEALVNENYAPLVRARNIILDNLNRGISFGLHYAVTCAEEYPHIKALVDNGALDQQGYYLGDSVTDTLLAACSVWPKALSGVDKKQALVSTIPSLLLAGEFDPITPPDYARQVSKGLSYSKVLLFKGRAHSVASFGCGPKLIHQFIDSASVDDLNESCLARLNTLPIYLNANGFSP